MKYETEYEIKYEIKDETKYEMIDNTKYETKYEINNEPIIGEGRVTHKGDVIANQE